MRKTEDLASKTWGFIIIYTSKMDDLDVKNGDLAMENEDKHGDSNITWI